MDTSALARAPWFRLALPARDRVLIDRRAVPVYAVILLAASVVTAAIVTGAFGYDTAFFRGTSFALAFLLLLCFAARWLSFTALGNYAEAIVLFLVMAILAPLCAAILASTNLPLADHRLAGIDKLFFGFDRRVIVGEAVAHWPRFMRAMIWIYNSLSIQPFLCLAILFFGGNARRGWTLVLAWSIALAICVAISPLVPAYGTPPFALRFIDVLNGARDGSLHVLNSRMLTGIITFPSFHAAGAAMLAWGFRRIPGGFLLVAFNAAMTVSALFVGGHYLIDLIAGTLVAISAIFLAKYLQARIVD